MGRFCSKVKFSLFSMFLLKEAMSCHCSDVLENVPHSQKVVEEKLAKFRSSPEFKGC